MDEEPLSKTQKKREADRLQALGVALIALDDKTLATFTLTPELLSAVQQAKTLKSHGAQRRQAQFIGKLMRLEDATTIEEQLMMLKVQSDGQTAQFHRIEQWRDRLLTGGTASLTAFVNEYPLVDIQTLRLLIKRAIQEKNDAKPVGASKALFRFLRSLS